MPESAGVPVRYRVEGASYLTDAAERRFVRISPAAEGFVVDHGEFEEADEPDFRSVTRTWFERGELPAAVQRFAALTGEWLGFDEFEVEHTRPIFVLEPV